MEHEWNGFNSVKQSDMMKKVDTSVSKKIWTKLQRVYLNLIIPINI